MPGDDREQALAELLLRVDQVGNGAASLEALYALESGFVYSDFWYSAREKFREVVASRGQQEAWLPELRRQPPDQKLWVPFMDRRRLTDASLAEARKRWEASGNERYFKPHHFVSRCNDGVAALHITLLSDLDPVGAVEYTANLPNEQFIWSATHRLQIHEQPTLVDRVLGESSSANAVLLSLACEVEAARSLVWKLGNDVRWQAQDDGAVKNAEAALETAWSETIPKRFQTVAKMLIARADAGAVIGPLMRHLVRSAVRGTTADLLDRTRVVRVALDALLDAVPGSNFDIDRAEKADAACAVSRILIAVTRGQIVNGWDEWVALVRNEDRSLDDDNEIYWGVAGDALRRTADPFATWTDAARQLEPLLRKRARWIEGGSIDPGVHLVMPAVNAAAAMKADGKQLWWALYERARRHFFIDAPPENEFGYRLCSYVFGAYPQVFGNTDDLETALGLLPTKDHAEWARGQVSANRPRGDHGAEEVAREADAR